MEEEDERGGRAALKVLDLFSGIGGFSLGLERTGGFKTVAFCEIEPFCQRVLKKHWPEVPIYDDIKELTGARLAADGIAVDVICGGFPCQDVSFAGKRAGLQGARSGLWSEYGRIIGEVRPRFVLVENVPGLLNLGMGTVLGDLAALGYDAQWDCIPASAIGAPHRRDRLWLVAHSPREHGERRARHGEQDRPEFASGGALADAAGARRYAARPERSPKKNGSRAFREPSRSDWWLAEPALDRMAYGIPDRLDRLTCLGNAVVPQIPELIGRAILEACHD